MYKPDVDCIWLGEISSGKGGEAKTWVYYFGLY
jgi:hypothetical protein